MSEQEEGEIEFLDEDADIVQQCVQVSDYGAQPIKTQSNTVNTDGPFLVERIQDKQLVRQESSKRKRKVDDDSDYDPTEDIIHLNTQKTRKRRQHGQKIVSRARHFELVPKTVLKIKRDPYDPKMDVNKRRKLQLRVPDYDDPLCLPVRAMKKDNQELRKLKNWNNLCLDRFKNYDTLLRADKLPTVSSKRTVVLRNLHNVMSGKIETTMHSRLTVENKNGEKESEVVQLVLPKYREKKLLNNYRLTDPQKEKKYMKHNKTYIKEEVLLTREVYKEVESLVVYKPKDSLSLVYKLFENKSHEKEEENRNYLKEVACCKICAPCYQTSWRAFKKITNNTSSRIRCNVCNRPCISMYNLLAHLKSHNSQEVRACKKEISKSLAAAMEYHYKCRICQQVLSSISELRMHVRDHKGTELFKCEVCNKLTN